MSNRYLFGPVASRRLGRSLGVDIVPAKTCSYHCIYCEAGRTTRHTRQRREYIPVRNILAEIQRKLREKDQPNIITITGSGEPTLHSGLGRIIAAIKKITNIPVAVLTNGSLLWQKAVRQELRAADLVLPSLDAWDEESFKTVNRPVPGLSFERMVRGLRAFGREYRGQIWLEILLTANCLPDDAGLKQFKKILAGIRADKIQLNTVDRPPAENWARPVGRRTLQRVARFLGKKAEVVAKYSNQPAPRYIACGDTRQPVDSMSAKILASLARRPGTVEDISAGLKISVPEAKRHLAALAQQKRVKRVRQKRGVFYRLA